MSINIDHLSVDELVTLNHHVIGRLKMLKSLDAHKSMMQFHPGARVSFDSPHSERLSGTVMKFNRKTVTVVTENGQRWNISPHLLSPMYRREMWWISGTKNKVSHAKRAANFE